MVGRVRLIVQASMYMLNIIAGIKTNIVQGVAKVLVVNDPKIPTTKLLS